MSRFYALKAVLGSVSLIVLAAVNCPSFRWLEGYFCGLATSSTDSIVHWSVPSVGSRLRAANVAETVAAIYRAVSGRLERHLRFLAAVRTDNVKHLTF